jgi:hypothetical protein
MTEDKTFITEREKELLATIVECRKQQSEAAMRIKEARTELAKLAPHKVGEVANIIIKGRSKNTGGWLHPKFVMQPDKQVEAVLTKVEAEISPYCDRQLYYQYTLKPVKKDGGISQKAIYIREDDTVEWTGVIHKDYKEDEE